MTHGFFTLCTVVEVFADSALVPNANNRSDVASITLDTLVDNSSVLLNVVFLGLFL
jgi:hypothetical protein